MSFENEMADALQTFMHEAIELLHEMESGLLALEQDGTDEESVNSVFRAAHTLKGSAGLFGLDPVVRFTHVVESVLDRLRSHELQTSAELIGVLLPCKDHIGDLIETTATAGPQESPAQAVTGADLLVRLHPFLTGKGRRQTDRRPPATAAARDVAQPSHRMHLSLRFGPQSLRNGMDPLSFVRYLSTLGEIIAITTVGDLIPDVEQMDPELCYLDFEVTLSTAARVADVAAVFDFVREESDIRILTGQSTPQEFAELVSSFGRHSATIREILLRTGASSVADPRDGGRNAGLSTNLADFPVEATEPTVPNQRTGPSDPLAGDSTNPPTAAIGSDATNTAAARNGTDRAGADNQTIRVDAARLDRLIDAVGELVIASAGADLRASTSHDKSLQTSLGDVMRLVEVVRDDALQLRMVPIGTTFSRFQRIVRDVSAGLGKDVTLLISGGDTEVDKALVEQIGDPLTHLVRNALDHGIESPQIRVAHGKPGRGTLRLNAFHDSGSIVIEVHDDGGGIDPARVRAKAIDRGLVEPDAVLSQKEINDLIFEAGFSTADAVSNLSGRGVGMDVVKQNVTALRGTIDLESQPGQSTTVRIRLPLTLAIIDGFLIGIGGATFVIPLDQVVECVELPAESRIRAYAQLRGEVLPLVRLRSLFDVPGERPRRENVVVVEHAGTKTGLVVDALKGEFQTVIKPLGGLFSHVQGIGGSTIMGNGDVALIIDVPMLIQRAENWQHQQLVSSGT